ncbi:TonB-dependent receptor domain-containing protein [Selenomonas sp. F0473]|uniref:TonB-dependent receptor domain-containing protein n=1 Tax=Selenomonas sp. F0473 TaxID=999423 RepID=UPI0025F6A293|nr:TonB-dependent receptor [Selenomonas sp. F0473]
MRKKQVTTAVLTALICAGGGQSLVHAGHDENLTEYTLDDVVVEANRIQNKFGDTITEQSYYRTGGDVKVITREEIEKRHYKDITEAIKRIPGVTFNNPGYRGGEYGYQFYNNGVLINGDSRVIILVDGRRVDNAASQRIGGTSRRGSKSTGVNLDQVTNMENIDKIEVIKGPGASVYGSDATGGVINIITRKGGYKNYGSLDISSGSWRKHNYAVTYSGALEDDPTLHFFFSANREMSGDTKFKDGETGEVLSLSGSHYKESGVNFRIDKDFDARHSLRLWYNHKNGRDGYPVATPRAKFWNELDWYRILFEVVVGRFDGNYKLTDQGQWWTDQRQPGYHNIYLTRSMYNISNDFYNNDFDLVYTFDRIKGMESFARYYYQNHRYLGRDAFQFSRFGGGGGNGAGVGYAEYQATFPHGTTFEQWYAWAKARLAPFPAGDKDAIARWVADTGGLSPITDWHRERNQGLEVQYAKVLGKNDVIANVSYDIAQNYSRRRNRNGGYDISHLDRKTWTGYVQDKIHVTDKWDLTPALRYAHYSSFENTNVADTNQGKGSVGAFTYALNSQYMFDPTASMYFGWTRIFRPLREGDYSIINTEYPAPLRDERGNVLTVGVRKELGDRTTLAAHYNWTNMTNAIATLPIWSPSRNDFSAIAVNARQKATSFNITLDHDFDKHLTMSLSYDRMKDHWAAKEGMRLDPRWGYTDSDDVNTAMNRLRPANHYALNLSYENGKLYTGLLTNWYTGNNTRAFTARSFLLLDWNINYEATKDLDVYMVVSNLTNTAYETTFNARNGIGSSAMPARSVLVGAKYKF